jgi:hypothetical protein
MIPSQNQYSSLNRCPGCGGFVEGQAECLACARAATDGLHDPGSRSRPARSPRTRIGSTRDVGIGTGMDGLIAAVLPPDQRSTGAPLVYAPVDMVGAAIRRQLAHKHERDEDDQLVAAGGDDAVGRDHPGSLADAGGSGDGVCSADAGGSGDAGGADDAGGEDDVVIPREADIFLGRPPDRLQRAVWRANRFIDG